MEKTTKKRTVTFSEKGESLNTSNDGGQEESKGDESSKGREEETLQKRLRTLSEDMKNRFRKVDRFERDCNSPINPVMFEGYQINQNGTNTPEQTPEQTPRAKRKKTIKQ